MISQETWLYHWLFTVFLIPHLWNQKEKVWGSCQNEQKLCWAIWVPRKCYIKTNYYCYFLFFPFLARLTLDRYASMFSCVIDGSVTNSKSSRTVITATPRFRKKSVSRKRKTELYKGKGDCSNNFIKKQRNKKIPISQKMVLSITASDDSVPRFYLNSLTEYRIHTQQQG